MSLVPEKITPPALSRRSRATAPLGREAGGAEQSHRVEAVLGEALRNVQLGHRRPDRCILAVQSRPGITIDHEAAGFQAELHVDDPIGNRLEPGDRLTELLPRLRVGDARFELPAHRAQNTREDRASLPFESGVEDGRTSTFATKDRVVRDDAVLENQFAHRGGAQAQSRDLTAVREP